ncbi:putative nrap protein [Rosellinia necatrix]|uniref:U3 small nucleolar RNA-associated protein 22 n=1 Tax=Rosellinia necatrix TaxID=77044 RepID=A0A1W2TNE6_ROSNE|nr:putative nrap protein [Rosellinia necatrix]
MESNSPKRRKLEHTSGGPALENLASSSMGASGSSAFVLETDELLKEVRMDYAEAFPGLDQTLRLFKEAIDSLDQYGPVPIDEACANWEKTSRTTIPFPDPKPAKNCPYKVGFEKPSHINVVGSYTSQTMVKSQSSFAVDMIVVMPASLFSEKDYRDYRYFYKRAFFLAYLADALRKKFADLAFTYSHFNGNALLPVLVARPHGQPSKSQSAGDKEPNYEIKIIPNAPEGYFPTAKLSATSNSLRRNASEDAKDGKEAPTPFYNSTLKSESRFVAYLKLLHRTSNTCAAFKAACILGRTWLQQRGFGGDVADGGFGHFHWAVLTALLLQTGGRKGEPILSPALHASQLFKATLQYLASSNLHKKTIILGPSTTTPEAVRQAGPVLYDSARELNILFNMTTWSAFMLNEHAKLSLSAVNDPQVDQFDSLFITKVDQPLQTFDLFIKIKLPSNILPVKSAVPDGRNPTVAIADDIYRILKKALGERAKLINIQIPKSVAWKIVPSSTKSKTTTILVGIMCDPAKASQGREYGPPYEQKKDAAKFREFWGGISELWQFPSGEIVESVNWTEFSPLGYFGICQAIIRYILKSRLKLADDNLEFHGQGFSNIISLSPADKTSFDAAKAAFSVFEKDVRELEDLPLSIKQIISIGPETRYASLHSPTPNQRKQGTTPIDVMLSFEASGKWPENIASIQRAKIALLLQIGRSLEETKNGIKTHLGLEDAERETENLAFLDIIYEGGFSFRLRVHSDQEETLLDRQTKDQTLDRHIRTEAAALLSTARWRSAVLPLHSQTISTYCTRFPALSSSIRLTKHWFNAHRLGNHFNEPLIELFVLQAFLRPHPFSIPSSTSTGFLRTLLMLATYDWREEPMIVDPSDSLSTSQRLDISTRLEAWRKIDANMNRTTLFVATPFETTGVAYTHDIPKVIATRMTTLARSASKAAKEKGVELDPRTLFQSGLRDYDVVIHLSSKAIKGVLRDDGTKHSQFKNLDESGSSEALPLHESPVPALLRRLHLAYEAPLLFFHGGPEDTVIAALWNPQLHSRGFSAVMPSSFKPAAGTDTFELNREAILAEIARIGGDLIEKIDVKESS